MLPVISLCPLKPALVLSKAGADRGVATGLGAQLLITPDVVGAADCLTQEGGVQGSK